jgi:hypothetical protein
MGVVGIVFVDGRAELEEIELRGVGPREPRIIGSYSLTGNLSSLYWPGPVSSIGESP